VTAPSQIVVTLPSPGRPKPDPHESEATRRTLVVAGTRHPPHPPGAVDPITGTGAASRALSAEGEAQGHATSHTRGPRGPLFTRQCSEVLAAARASDLAAPRRAAGSAQTPASPVQVGRALARPPLPGPVRPRSSTLTRRTAGRLSFGRGPEMG